MTKVTMKRFVEPIWWLLVATLLAPWAHAAERTRTTAIEEIVVTAQKREESSQDVPIAVTALDAAAIEKTFARDLLDVTGAAPNLVIDPILGNGTAAISIRGMQLNDVEKSFDPAVAVYMDGIYLATTTGALLQVWDAEAIEVLRGPQGTLFGRNTIGGLVHVRRAKPTGEWGGRVTATIGQYDRRDINATINTPALLDGTLSFKATVMTQDGGGYFDNRVRGKDEGDNDFLGMTAMMLWEPTDDFSLWLTYDRFDDETPTRPVTSLTQAGEVFDGFCGTLGLCGGLSGDESYHRHPTTTTEQSAFIETDAVTANLEWHFNENHSLHVIGGWRDTDEDAFQEFDGIGSTAAAFPANGDFFRTQRPQTLEQTSIEVRWQGDWNDGRVRSVLGAYWMDTEYTLEQRTTSLLFFGVPGAPGFSGIFSSEPQFVQETDTLAFFGQLDVDLSENWTVSVGGRFTDEEKEACGVTRLNFGAGPVGLTSYGGTGLSLCDASSGIYTADFVDPLSGATVAQDGKESWTSFTPRVGVTYNFEQGMVYASYSEGFRSGGFNGRSTAANNLGPYEPEEVETIELGFKTQWLDNRLQVNGTIFTTDYQDKQEDVVFPDPVAVTVTLVQNAASASIDGAELEVVAVPADGFTLSASVGLLDSEYDDYLIRDIAGNALDQSDFDLRRAPELTFSLNGLYERQLSNGNFLVFSANYMWRDDYWVIARTNNSQPGRPGFNSSFGLLDVSISYETPSWRVSLFGKNLTDEDYFLHVLDVSANEVAASATDPTPVYVPGLWTFGTINAPRTWGLEVDFKF